MRGPPLAYAITTKVLINCKSMQTDKIPFNLLPRFNKLPRFYIPYEPRSEKTGLRGFRPGPTQTGLYSHRKWLEA